MYRLRLRPSTKPLERLRVTLAGQHHEPRILMTVPQGRGLPKHIVPQPNVGGKEILLLRDAEQARDRCEEHPVGFKKRFEALPRTAIILPDPRANREPRHEGLEPHGE